MSGADSTTEVTPTGRYKAPSLSIDTERPHTAEFRARPKGPAVNRPGREAGQRWEKQHRAPKARHSCERRIGTWRASFPGHVSHLRRSFAFAI